MTTTDAIRNVRGDLEDLGGSLAERYHDLEEELQDLPIDEVVDRAQLGAWQALQAGLGGLLTLPALAVRGLGALSGIADEVVTRGGEVSERGRELIASVPPSRAQRRRARTRAAGIASLGLLVGFVTGWLMAGRKQTMVTYEPTLPESWEPAPGPTPAADLLDIRSEAERPEPPRGG